MNADDIIRMAREAGFLIDGDSWVHAGAVLIDGRKSIDKQLKNFANLVAAAERAKCLQIADEFANADLYASMVANAIRSRGELK